VGEELVLKAEIRSNVKKHVWTQGQKPYSRYASQREVRLLAATLFGAIAEDQNLRHGDNHDPEDCARAGEELYNKLCYQLAATGTVDLDTKGLTLVEGAS
jgi:hypothetical protein